MSSIRAQWQNGSNKEHTHRTTQTHAEYQDATDIQKKIMCVCACMCVSDFSVFIYLISLEILNNTKHSIFGSFNHHRSCPGTHTRTTKHLLGSNSPAVLVCERQTNAAMFWLQKCLVFIKLFRGISKLIPHSLLCLCMNNLRNIRHMYKYRPYYFFKEFV